MKSNYQKELLNTIKKALTDTCGDNPLWLVNMGIGCDYGFELIVAVKCIDKKLKVFNYGIGWEELDEDEFDMLGFLGRVISDSLISRDANCYYLNLAIRLRDEAASIGACTKEAESNNGQKPTLGGKPITSFEVIDNSFYSDLVVNTEDGTTINIIDFVKQGNPLTDEFLESAFLTLI